jgi:prevent-host-death family protein
MKTISASEANRQFSSLLRDVSQGEVVTILSRGKAVASIVPVNTMVKQRQDAKHRLVERLRQRKVTGQRDWTRDELYD